MHPLQYGNVRKYWYNNKTMYKRNIKKFSFTGFIGDETMWSESRRIMEDTLEDQVRAKGYLPVRDLDKGWFIEYDPMNDKYDFEITLYAIYVGKRKAREWDGFLMGKLLPHPHKSKQSSVPSV